MIALLLSTAACATTTSKPTPKLQPKEPTKQKPQPPVKKAAPKPDPVPDPDPPNETEAIERDFQPPPEVEPPAKCDGVKRAKIPANTNVAWPVDGVVITGFGKREGTPHDGIDIAAPRGTPIYASKTGEVLYSGEQAGYGRMVIIGHDAGMVTIYAHNELNCVALGAKVEQGEVIGLVGRSGSATSPAVHFEVRIDNKPVNPRAHLPK